jgi:hypothetical protein
MACGVAAVGTGIYWSVHAESLADELSSGRTHDSAKDDARNSAVTKQYVYYGAGSVLLLGGLAMALWGDNHSSVAMYPSVGPQYAGLALVAGSR